LKIAYFTNQYPKVSHSFIRREILALERIGFEITRLALRGWDESLPDPADRQEQRKTRYVLQHGILGLLPATLYTLIRSPRVFFAALPLAIKMSRRSERGLPYHFICIAEACRILTWLRKAGVPRIHAHFGTNSAEVAMFVHVLGGPPYSFTVHGPEEFLRPMGLEEKISRADFVAAISSFGRSQLYLNSRHIDWPRIKIVHCGLEDSFFGTSADPMVAGARLVCVGRLCEAKGQLLLIDAAAKLVAKGIALELVLAGDGPLRDEIEKSVRTYGLSKHVRITGWISSSDVRDEILAARALVLPSFAEGLPVVIMEAMALRRAVLSTYIAGIPELVKPGENGWLFAAGSIDELAGAMQDCLAQPAEVLRRMGDAGYQRVLEHHSSDTEARKLGELFREPAAH
jgi:colanic acid/amylovoran biosynthesis glycosyltransferase